MVNDFGIVPLQPMCWTQRFVERLFGGETGSERSYRFGPFRFGKEFFSQMRGALEGFLKPGDVYDIDTNPINHDDESISG